MIDFLGFRLIAISILPVTQGETSTTDFDFLNLKKFQETLRYGSADAGVTIHDDDPKLNGLMKQVAAKINLEEHKVSIPGQPPKMLCGPVDIGNPPFPFSLFYLLFTLFCYKNILEGHLGTDNNYYVLVSHHNTI